MADEVQNIRDARRLTAELIPLVEQAESQFRSARNWGFLDVFGGGMIVDLIKHTKLSSAGNTMSIINVKLNELQSVLGGIRIPTDYNMKVGDFATLADFVFDGAIMDIWMTGKIISSLNQVIQLKEKLYMLQDRLNRM